jgi:hypothetical protein
MRGQVDWGYGSGWLKWRDLMYLKINKYNVLRGFVCKLNLLLHILIQSREIMIQACHMVIQGLDLLIPLAPNCRGIKRLWFWLNQYSALS